MNRLKNFYNSNTLTCITDQNLLEPIPGNLSNKNRTNDGLASNIVLSKIKKHLQCLFIIYSNKIAFQKHSLFTKWFEIAKNMNHLEVLNHELEKRLNKKYEIKLSETSRIFIKSEKENKDILLKLEYFEKNKAIYLKKIIEFEDKEKEQNRLIKTLKDEQKKKFEVLKEIKAELKTKLSIIDNYISELEQCKIGLKEYEAEKETFLNSYISDMNSLLDFYEQRSSKPIYCSMNFNYLKKMK